jgi:hypothetical protein
MQPLPLINHETGLNFFPRLLHVFLSIQAQPLLAGALYDKAGDHLAKSSPEKIKKIISLNLLREDSIFSRDDLILSEKIQSSRETIKLILS